MIPGQYQMNLYRGDTGHWSIAVWTDNERTLPADLTGVTVAAQIRDTPRGHLVVTLDLVVTLPNTIDMRLSAASSTILPPNGYWDLQLTYTAGDVFTVLRGPVLVTNDVTF